MLTNSDQLSARFELGTGNLMSSTVAQAFVNAFVTGPLGRQSLSGNKPSAAVGQDDGSKGTAQPDDLPPRRDDALPES